MTTLSLKKPARLAVSAEPSVLSVSCTPTCTLRFVDHRGRYILEQQHTSKFCEPFWKRVPMVRT